MRVFLPRNCQRITVQSAAANKAFVCTPEWNTIPRSYRNVQSHVQGTRGSSSEPGGVAWRALSLHVSPSPEPRLCPSSPGAHWVQSPEMRTRVTTVTTGFGVKGELESLERVKSQPSPISVQLSGVDTGSLLVLSDNFPPSPPSQNLCENRNAIRQEPVVPS